jgi:hypothetical protein
MTMQVEIPASIQDALNSERYHHPVPLVQRRMEALWLKSHGLPHGQIAQLVGITENTLRDYFQLYREGGAEGLKAVAIQEAQHAIEVVTGIKRRESQVREFLKKNSSSAVVASACSPPKPTPTLKPPISLKSENRAEPGPRRASAPFSLSLLLTSC